MKSVRYEGTLFYYDGPQVFEARDAIGGHYVAVNVDSDLVSMPEKTLGEARDRYLVVGVAPEQLRQFRAGAIDLRSLLVGSDENECYTATAENVAKDALELGRLTTPLLETGFLPDEGFLLHDQASDTVLREARERNNFVLEIVAEPPEAATQHRIHAETLAGVLHHAQAMIRQAYRKARMDYGIRRQQPTDALLDVVVPAASGSFRVVLEAADRPDLSGDTELEWAFPQVDTLFEAAASPQATLAFVRDNRGDLAGSYLQLLRFLARNRMGLRYSWAVPSSETPTIRAVLEGQTRPLIEALSSVEKLANEKVILEGKFEKFNRNTGAWGLSMKDGSYSGKIADEGPNLDGLEVGASYRFFCDEEVEEVFLTGKEKRILYLNRHERI